MSDAMNIGNAAMIEQFYASYVQDPESVDTSWRYFFEGMNFSRFDEQEVAHDLRIFCLVDAYRRCGHLKARTNPLDDSLNDPDELKLETLGFSPSELGESFPTVGFLSTPRATLQEIIDALEKIYCQSIGIEYIGRHSPELETFIQEKIEPTHFRPDFSVEKKQLILQQLNKAELFEIFLHTKYVGQKRFSLEGGETLIPILEWILAKGGDLGMDECVLGMAHRGRLNVLVNVLNKSFSMIFSEFEDSFESDQRETASDVKYHKGFSADVTIPSGKNIHVSLTANPSHLESVDPVVQGRVRAKQTHRGDVNKEKVFAVQIHGDSSLPGQGVVYETMQLCDIPGYRTGGTVHVVVNNQIGFTTLPYEYRSSVYSTDIAAAFGAPVFHVNAEDPEGCVFATELAIEIRQKFHCDVFIEMNCYRKYGHNEGDEPAFTQPVQTQLIKKKKSIREIYQDHLIHSGILEQKMAQSMEKAFQEGLHYELEEMKLKKERAQEEAFGGVWKEYRSPQKEEIFSPIKTGLSVEALQQLTRNFSRIPEGFAIHPKLKKLVEKRLQMATEQKKCDWALAEHLAFASLLKEGHNVRLSGQDSMRGTFAHRHAVWVDQTSAERYFPLSHLGEGARFSVFNSTLSEYAVLGFEFGYSLAFPSALVMWEAQFGDFANTAQVIIDQYISTSEQKWRRYSGLVLLLPHGYEGGGSEHSSARIERYLQLCAEENMQVVNPTTPAQYFHLLRRHIKLPIRLPLVIFTPKSFLRHPSCESSLDELAEGTFSEILVEPQSERLLLCSGKVYYDLLKEREERGRTDISIGRIEQLYPLHKEKLRDVMAPYRKIAWVQEEPHNMGSLGFLAPYLLELKSSEAQLDFVSRKRSASSATGSHAAHVRECAELMDQVFKD